VSRMTKEELRHDSFVEGTARITAYLQRHFMTVLVGVAIAALVVVGAIYIQQSRHRSQTQASQLMYRATSEYASGAYSQALLSLDDIISRFGGTSEGKSALYFSGACHLALGENDAAVEHFQEYLDEAPHGFYRDQCRAGLALALEDRGDLADAAQSFRDLRESLDKGTELYRQATFGEARILQKLGQYDAAIAVLQDLTTADDFAARQQAESRIAVLKSLLEAAAL
jgi:tetratricopeptide (TPR) repeat protein